MPAPSRTPREQWVNAALTALAAGGPDAVRIETLAQSLGVTKGGFYWQFADRQALLDEVLDTWERRVCDDVIKQVDAAQTDARTALQRLFDIAASMRDVMGVELAVREWARRDPHVLRRLRGLDKRRMEYMCSLFVELGADPADAEARSYLAFSLFIANNYIHLQPGERSRRGAVERATRHLLT